MAMILFVTFSSLAFLPIIWIFNDLRLHRDAEVQHAQDLESRQDDKGGGGTERRGDNGEEEGDQDVEDPHQDVGDGGALIDEIGWEVLRRHHEEQGTRSALKSEDEEEKSEDGDNGETLDEEGGNEGDGADKHDGESDHEDGAARQAVDDGHEDEDSEHVPETHHEDLHQHGLYGVSGDVMMSCDDVMMIVMC